MEDQAPDHEDIHLPSPSVAPIIVAGGITFTVVGVLNPSLFVVGLVMLAVGIAIWAFSRG